MEGRRLFLCLLRWLRAVFPATEMSAPESGKISMSAAPLRDEMWTDTVGAGSTMCASLMLDVWIRGDCFSLGGVAWTA